MEIFLLLFAGLVLLFTGGELLVRGSSSLAISVGLSPLVIGLTVVAFGTSSPELVVSIQAALKGNSAISVGNVVGSNIANIGLILGISAIIRPVKVQSDAVMREIPFMVIVSAIFSAFVFGGNITFLAGFFFVALLILYIIFSIYNSKKNTGDQIGEVVKAKYPTFVSVIFVLLGLGGLAFGSDLFIDGAVRLAKALGVSELLIGLTVVAVGTSLPELVTSIVASVKKESDILVGNVVGSNIFNILAIIGIAAIIVTIRLHQLNIIDVLVMIYFSVIILPMSLFNRLISRREGLWLLISYCLYIFYLAYSA